MDPKTFPLENYQASSILHDSSSNLLIIGTTSGDLLQYDLTLNQITKSIKTTLLQISSLLLLKNSTIYAGGSNNIQLFSQHLDLLSDLKDHNDSVIGLGYFEGSLISASEDQTVRRWLPNKSEILYFHDSPLIAFDLSASLSKIVTSCSDSVLVLFSLESKKTEKKIESLCEKIWSLKFVSKKSTLIAGDHSGTLTIRTVPDLEEIQKISLHESRVKGLAVSPDETFFLSCSFDQTVLVFQTDDNKNVFRFEAHHDWVRAACVSLNESQENSCFYRKVEKVYCGFSVADDKSLGIFEFHRESLAQWNFWIFAILAGMICSVLIYYLGFNGASFSAQNTHQDLANSDQKFVQTEKNTFYGEEQKNVWAEAGNFNNDKDLDSFYSLNSDVDGKRVTFMRNHEKLEESEGFDKTSHDKQLDLSEDIQSSQTLDQDSGAVELRDSIQEKLFSSFKPSKSEHELGKTLLQLND